MKNNYYQLILSKLSGIAPLFAKSILDKAITRRGKSPSNVSAIDLLDILKSDINPKLSQGTMTTNALSQAGSGFIITNEKNRVIHLSSYIQKILKVQGMDLTQISSEAFFNNLVNLGFCSPIHLAGQLLVREACPLELRQTYDVTIAPIINERGAITGTISTIKDITLQVALEDEVILQNKKLKEEIVAREKVEKELRENQAHLIHTSKLASLGEMAGGIAHEINNPLAAINITVQALKKQLQKENSNKKIIMGCIEDIEATVVRIHKIVTGLRTISRDNEHDSSDEMSAVLLQDILNDVMGLCSEKLKSNGVEFTVEGNHVLEKNILCRRVPLSQVLINLIQNAYDAIENNDDKWIKMTFSLSDQLLSIKVTDSGHGIEQEVVDKIFQPFFTTKEAGRGTGIGLSISKSIIDKHKGRLFVDHTCPNTCFVIEIPQAA